MIIFYDGLSLQISYYEEVSLKFVGIIMCMNTNRRARAI